MRRLRNSRFFRAFAVFVTFSLVWQMIHPAVAYGLTSGPSQPEMQGFEPIGTTEMVDLFSGDFKYNIPLLDVGGYPINMVYNSGVTMDQEASWVGLGWSLNPGAINRNLRGIPDDFNGDEVVEDIKMRPNRTLGLTVGFGLQILGNIKIGPGVKLSSGIFHNNYKGWGFTNSFEPSLSIGKLGISANFSANSQNGVSLSPSVSFSQRLASTCNGDNELSNSLGLGFSASYNSRGGLSEMTFSSSLSSSSKRYNDVAKSQSIGNSVASFTLPITYTPSYFPTGDYSMKNFSLYLSATVGGAFYTVHPSGSASGYYSTQGLRANKIYRKAYGYEHLSQGYGIKQALLDYNTEKDGRFSEYSPVSYLAGLTHDTYSVTGQGLSGMFRPHRNDVGYGFDPASKMTSTSANIGVEGGLPLVFHIGGSGSIVRSTTTNSNWDDQNDAHDAFPNRDRDNLVSSIVAGENKRQKALYQDTYFKFSGEPHHAGYLFDAFGEFEPGELKQRYTDNYREQLTARYVTRSASNTFGTNPNSPNYQVTQSSRKKNVQALTATEAKQLGMDKWLYTYDYEEQGSTKVDSFERDDSYREPHHFSEFRITDEQGWTYNYGIPAYNTKQYEVSFNTAGTGDCSTGLVRYGSGENSMSNEVDPDHYFNKRSIPPYAYGFLLTEVLPPDYSDVDGKGISERDYGNPVKLKYQRTTGSYKWRTPFGLNNDDNEGWANFNEGLKSIDYDNKANYVYGEKELWYLHRVESKTHVAEFYTSPRNDAMGAVSENGGIDDLNPLMKLDSIKLFSRVDLEQNGSNAIPIKSVYFSYEYSLCPVVPNFNGASPAKLTLKELYFTYGGSKKAKLNRYVFHYGDYDHNLEMDETVNGYPYNPSYNMRGYDRWGSYKPNTEEPSCKPEDPINNVDAPYTPQDTIPSTDTDYYDSDFPGRTYADAYAVAWNLTTIELPSGGLLKVQYEADDYAYVQDKRAMQMFSIHGLGTSASVESTNKLYDQQDPLPRNYVFFKLQDPFGDSELSQKQRDYFEGLDLLYFKMLMEATDREYEYVPGYCEVEATGFSKSGGADYTHGWVKVKSVGIKDEDKGRPISPLLKAALQYTRIHLPDHIYPGSNPNGSGGSAIQGLASVIFDIISMHTGYNNMLLLRGFCESIITDKSFIRLNTPTYQKKGGGSRVKKLTISDQWADFVGSSNGSTVEYGQEYTYTMDSPDETSSGRAVSSGVASYEPMIGNEENPFRMPVTYNIKNALAPDDENYVETPFGEMFFPSPSVGYSKVVVRNIQHESVTRTATGWSVHEFYTARDFPTQTSRTRLDPEFRKLDAFDKFLKKRDRRLLAASQGFAVVVNDMHGKPKSTHTYNTGGDPIGGTEYYYKTTEDGSVLDNNVQMIKPDASLVTANYGMEVDVTNHFKSSDQVTTITDIQGNVDGIFVFVAIPIPMIWVPGGKIEHRYRLASSTKVIQQYGILERVVAKDFGSTIETRNLAYDYNTGETLLTQTVNEYHDTVYNMTYPAYLAYPGMDAASLNTNVRFDNVDITDGVAGISGLESYSIQDFFERGDQVMVINSSGVVLNDPLWVLDIQDSYPTDVLLLIDREGHVPTLSNVSLKVVKSGKRNTPTLPVATVTAFANPMDGDFYNDPKVVNAEAMEYTNYWQTFPADCEPGGIDINCDIDPPVVNTTVTIINDLASADQAFAPTSYFELDGLIPVGPNTSFPSYDEDLWSLNPVDTPHYWQAYKPKSNRAVGVIGYSVDQGSALQFTLDSEFELPAGFSNDWATYWETLDEVILDGVDTVGHTFSYTLNTQAVFRYSTVEDTVDMTITSTDGSYRFAECSESVTGSGSFMPGVDDTINPFVHGILGNWHKTRDWQFQVDRAYDAGDMRYDGTFNFYEPFWVWEDNNLIKSPPEQWISPVEVTKRSAHGNEVENKDILGLYSAAHFGYGYTLPVDVVQNAQYREAGFESYEDLGFWKDTCALRHMEFMHPDKLVTNDFAHTGEFSLKVPEEGTAVYQTEIQLGSCGSLPSYTFPYLLKDCEVLHPFSPGSTSGNKDYILSFWYRYDQDGQVPSYEEPDVDVVYNSQSVVVQDYFVSPIIEGWQKKDVIIKLPAVAEGNSLQISIGNMDSDDLYLDDVRAFPFNGHMKGYVYDIRSLRLVAELDENNYATFYEYDQEGILVRVKKETEEGIVTIQETRQHKHLNQ